MNYITIATDISYDERFDLCTWACYIRHRDGVIKEVHEFKKLPKNTAMAETYALINALVIAKRLPSFQTSKVIIHNEIEYVLDPIKSKAGNVRLKDKERTEAIRSVALPILKEALEWERRKIKAHFKDWKTSDNPAKYAINRWCDIESRKHLRELRQKRYKVQ